MEVILIDHEARSWEIFCDIQRTSESRTLNLIIIILRSYCWFLVKWCLVVIPKEREWRRQKAEVKNNMNCFLMDSLQKGLFVRQLADSSSSSSASWWCCCCCFSSYSVQQLVNMCSSLRRRLHLLLPWVVAVVVSSLLCKVKGINHMCTYSF